jgi:Mor family transcriptional regulator
MTKKAMTLDVEDVPNLKDFLQEKFKSNRTKVYLELQTKTVKAVAKKYGYTDSYIYKILRDEYKLRRLGNEQTTKKC